MRLFLELTSTSGFSYVECVLCYTIRMVLSALEPKKASFQVLLNHTFFYFIDIKYNNKLGQVYMYKIIRSTCTLWNVLRSCTWPGIIASNLKLVQYHVLIKLTSSLKIYQLTSITSWTQNNKTVKDVKEWQTLSLGS